VGSSVASAGWPTSPPWNDRRAVPANSIAGKAMLYENFSIDGKKSAGIQPKRRIATPSRMIRNTGMMEASMVRF
jgi:hypothetical protein